jgi:hypothetical protein
MRELACVDKIMWLAVYCTHISLGVFTVWGITDVFVVVIVVL